MKQATGAKRGRKRRLSREEMASREKGIIDDIKAGVLSYREIAQKHDVSLPTVNNKARKAGISRGRRKGARIVVSAPARKKAARRGRPARRKTGARRGRPPASAAMAAASTNGRRRRGARKTGARRGRPPGRRSRQSQGFMEALRKLVLRYNPNISLVKFEELSRTIASGMR